jgi:kynurenine formamidase
VAKKIRGVMFEENLKNSMGLEFYNLSHRFGYQSPNWPYFEDVKIERIHYMAKSGVLSQRITTSMHNTTHIDAPAHVIQGTPFIDEVPLPHFFGSGIVVSIPKNKWEPITGDDLEKACGKIVRPRDVVIVNTGWHKFYEDSEDYFCRAPGFVPSAGEWFVKKKVKVIGHDTQANDHPLATAIGPQRNGPLHPHLAEEYREWSGGRDWKDDFPEWEPVHRILFKNGIMGIENVGGDIDKVTGKRCTFWSPSWTPRKNSASKRGAKSNARQTLFRRKGLRGAQSSRLHFAAAVRRRGRRHQGADLRVVAFPARRRRRAGRLAAREGLFRAARRTHRHRQRQGDRAEGERFLRDRAERDARDHQPRQRGVFYRRRGGNAAEVTGLLARHHRA